MHTSERIDQSDFVYRRLSVSEDDILSFDEAYPDYHRQDRVGIVSPQFEDGISGTASAILSLATGFYDCLRSSQETFFDYPQHLVFIGSQGSDAITYGKENRLSLENCGRSWGWLDVWPATNWNLCPATPESMLDAVYRNQINRVFWPASFLPVEVENPLSNYAQKLLNSRLKSVWYYDCSEADMEVQISKSVENIIRESVEMNSLREIGDKCQGGAAHKLSINNRFKMVKPEEFIEDMSVCFSD